MEMQLMRFGANVVFVIVVVEVDDGNDAESEIKKLRVGGVFVCHARHQRES